MKKPPRKKAPATPAPAATAPAATAPRARRAPPARTRPVRDTATLLRPAPEERASEAAVEGAYRVLDDHLRRGQQTAQAQSPRPAAAAEPARGDAMAEAARLVLRAVSDTWRVWADALGPATAQLSEALRGEERGVVSRVREAVAPEADAHFSDEDRRWREVRPSFLPDAPTIEPVRAATPKRSPPSAVDVGIEVQSARRFVARVALQRALPAHDLRVGELRATEGPCCIRGFVLDEDADGMTLRGEVPDDVPADTYTATVWERGTRRGCGTVTLTVRG